jgi:hypothetical protein
VLDLRAEDGKFDLVAYDIPADTEPVAVTKALDTCAKENEDDFYAFSQTLVAVPEQYNDVRDAIAYRLWLGNRALSNGEPGIVNSKLVSSETSAWQQAITSFAFDDAEKAVSLILALPTGFPFIQGYATLRLLEAGLLKKTSRDTVYKLYDALRTRVLWWQENRTIDGKFYYAYRYETGIAAPQIFSVGAPVSSPDLYAYLITASQALALLADETYNGGDAIRWTARAKELTEQLVAELWRDGKFIAKNLYTGETTAADTLLANMTLLAGQLLPRHIAAPLVEKLNVTDLAGLGILAAFGASRGGNGGTAKSLAEKLLDDARKNGITDTAYGAALLALAAETQGV